MFIFLQLKLADFRLRFEEVVAQKSQIFFGPNSAADKQRQVRLGQVRLYYVKIQFNLFLTNKIVEIKFISGLFNQIKQNQSSAQLIFQKSNQCQFLLTDGKNQQTIQSSFKKVSNNVKSKLVKNDELIRFEFMYKLIFK